MRELNFDNEYSNDDDTLISILKESLSNESSQQFTENTLKKFSAQKAKQKTIHKPLKSPLYMMAVITLSVLIAIFFTSETAVNLSNDKPDFISLLDKINIPLDSWYIPSVMLLALFLFSLIRIELGRKNLGKPII